MNANFDWASQRWRVFDWFIPGNFERIYGIYSNVI